MRKRREKIAHGAHTVGGKKLKKKRKIDNFHVFYRKQKKRKMKEKIYMNEQRERK